LHGAVFTVFGERSEPTLFTGFSRPRFSTAAILRCFFTAAIFTAAIFRGFWRAKRANPFRRGFAAAAFCTARFHGFFTAAIFTAAIFCVFGRILERPNPFHAALWGFLVGMAGGVPFCAVSTSMAQAFGARFLGVFGSLPENFSRSSNVAVQEHPIFDHILERPC